MRRLRAFIRTLVDLCAPAIVLRRDMRRIREERFGVGMQYEPELQLLPDLVSLGGMAIDVGANVGHYSGLLAELCGPDNVIAFEPLPRLKKRLQRALPGVRVVGAALSNREGTSVLRVPRLRGGLMMSRSSLEPLARESGQTGSTEVTVPVTTLDSWVERCCADRIGFLKIDVEGHEHSVLSGAAKTIERHRPIVLIEAEQRHHDFPLARVFELLYAMGYEGLYVDAVAAEVRPLALFSVQRDQARQHHGSRRYVANFVFIPTEFSVIGSAMGARLRSLAASAAE